jgi:large subunit ribosomal protein L29
MKNQELRELDSEALESQLKEHYEELFNLRFQQVMGKLTASGRPRIVKREVARNKTILRERELST